jgi:hypothetical protein
MGEQHLPKTVRLLRFMGLYPDENRDVYVDASIAELEAELAAYRIDNKDERTKRVAAEAELAVLKAKLKQADYPVTEAYKRGWQDAMNQSHPPEAAREEA